MTRREQWISFYTAALSGHCADPNTTCHDSDEAAEKSADLAMARLDARAFPKSKVEALLSAARSVWRAAEHKDEKATVPAHLLASLGKALAAFNDGSASPEAE